MASLATVAVTFVFIWSDASAYNQRSYDAYSLPVMYLNEGINSTITIPTSSSSIEIARPKINGISVTAQAMSGAIFEFKLGSKKEDIYSSRVVVNPDGTLTLSGSVIRGLCQISEARTFTSCTGAEASRNWPRGTEIRLTDNHRIFNLKADIDRRNEFRGSGSLSTQSTNQPFIFYKPVTTAQRDAFTYTGESNETFFIHNSTTGNLQYNDGGSYADVAFQTGSLTNATTTTRGFVTLSSTGSTFAGSGQGIGGAFNVLQALYTTQSGASIDKSGYVPIISGSTLDPSLLGVSAASGFFLKVNGHTAQWDSLKQSDLAANAGFPTTNLVARWSLNEASGNALDTFASLDLTEVGTPGTDFGISEPCAETDTAREWNSSGDSFERLDSVELSFIDDFSFEAWINVGVAIGTGEVRTILGNYNGTGDRGVFWAYSDSAGTPRLLLAASSTDSTTQLAVDKTLTTDQWYHYFVTYDESAGAANFYIDGELVGAEQTGGETTLNDTTGKFRLGCYSTDGSACNTAVTWEGELQEVKVWDAVKTADEIKAIYNFYERGCRIPLPTT